MGFEKSQVVTRSFSYKGSMIYGAAAIVPAKRNTRLES